MCGREVGAYAENVVPVPVKSTDGVVQELYYKGAIAWVFLFLLRYTATLYRNMSLVAVPRRLHTAYTGRFCYIRPVGIPSSPNFFLSSFRRMVVLSGRSACT